PVTNTASETFVALIIINGTGEGVGGQEGQAAREPLIYLHLQGVIVGPGIGGGKEHDVKVRVRTAWLQVAHTWVRLVGKQMEITQPEPFRTDVVNLQGP